MTDHIADASKMVLDLDKLEAPTDAQIEHAIRQTEYKYFGDYEFSEEQHLAVETLVRAASALSAARASAREAAAEIERLRSALKSIRSMKSEPIGSTGFAVGPAAMLSNCQRLADKALRKPRRARAAQMDGEG